MALNSYLMQTQRLVGDVKQEHFVPNDLKVYINIARRMVAEITQSVRALTPISGSITSITILTSGLNYTDPIVVISAPDLPGGTSVNPAGLQATATATADVTYIVDENGDFIVDENGNYIISSGGPILNVSLTNGGAGYFQPTATIVDPTGSGATLSVSVSPVTKLIANQEVYNFSDIVLPSGQGLGSILNIRSVAIIYDQYRYTLPWYSFTTYQTFVRQYPYQYTYVPTICSQLGQGANGSLYMYPIPSQTYSFQCDCICLPADLITDADVEALPQPWQDVVPYYAAYLAKLEAQDQNGARGLLDLFDKMILRHSISARPGRAPNRYGRFVIFLPLLMSGLLLTGAI